MIHKKMHQQEGLTLIELLVTIAVIAIIAAIALPTFTNIVSTTANRAAEQATKDVQTFISKWSATGTLSYDDATQTFTGYADLDGDGTVDADEKIEEITVDDTHFTVNYDGVEATSSNDISADYSTALPTGTSQRFTVTSTAYGIVVALTAPTVTPTIGNGFYGDYRCTVEPDCTNDTALLVALAANQSSGDAVYTTWQIERLVDNGSGNFSVGDFPSDWTAADVSTSAYGSPVHVTGLDTSKRYFFRFAVINSKGTSTYSDTVGIYYDPAAPAILGGPQWKYQDLQDVQDNNVNTTGG